MVAVVVPSPAWSLVLEATSLTICAPMFSNLSASSISLATVTPSLVTRGAPNDLSRTTLRPLGPSVTLTALARMSTPRNIRSRASELNLTSFAAIFNYSLCGLADSRLVDDPHDVGLFHDDQIFAVQLHFGARPLAEQHPVAGLNIQRMDLPIVAAVTRPNRHHLAFHRLFLRRVGDDDAAGTLFLRLHAPDQHAVMQWTESHVIPLVHSKFAVSTLSRRVLLR